MDQRKTAIFFILGLFFLLSFIDDPNSNLNALVTSDSIEVFSDADFITLGFPGSGTAEDPYRIENFSISSSDINNEGIYVKNTTKHFVIQGCEITSSFYGILVEEVTCDTCQIIDNYCYSNKHDGAAVKMSSGVIVSGNTFEKTVYATGFTLEDSSNILIKNNIFQNNPKSGMAIYSCSDINITRNTFRENHYKGITAASTSSCWIYENLFESNDEYGLEFIQNSFENIVFHNNFIDNFPGGISQARDSSGNSSWFNEVLLEGSYWSDYSGTGYYSIEGEEGCCDMYPLTEPVNLENPIITTNPTTNKTSFTYLLITFLSLPIIYSSREKRVK